MSVDADTDEEPDNHSITVEHIAMNYSDSLYAPFGLSELTTVDVGDFIGFYEGEFAQEGSKVIGYGRITSITPAAEMDVITYTDATVEDMKHVFDIYQKQALDGDLLLSNEDIAEIEDQIQRQAIASGFVDEAANYLSALALKTNEVKARSEVGILSASVGPSKVSVKNLTVVASLGTTLKNIAGRTSGVSATLQVGADIVVTINEDSYLVIHMTGTFLEEMSLDLGVDGSIRDHTDYFEILGKKIPYWYHIDDYVVTANLDAYSYTSINITAEIATVEKGNLPKALGNWAGEKDAGHLGQVYDIAKEIKALIEGVQDTGVDAAKLKKQYQKMLENETDWVPLIKRELVSRSKTVAAGLVEVEFTAEFVVSANANLTMGIDFSYKTAKRYSLTLGLISFTSNNSNFSLPGDGDYQFTFYVMGTLGLRAGVNMSVKAGVGKVEWDSIGLSAEPGAYVNLWGYFYYQTKNVNKVQSTMSSGALYLELGIYLEIAVGADVLDGEFSVSAPVYENTWPLYTVGSENMIDDFAYPQDDKLGLTLAGSATSIAVPESLLMMSTFNLKKGDTGTQAYNTSKFDIKVDQANFRYNASTQKIEVVNKSIPVSTGNLVITWKSAPLSFTSAPLKRTIPLTWLARAGDYTLQLDPQNGGVTKVVAAAYNAAINVTTPVYPGYTFDGWYKAASGGTKTTIPSQMPAEDLYLYAHWIANNNTPYTVQHYLIDPNTRTSTSPAYTEIRTGTTGTEIRITSDRFKNQGYADGTVSGVSIKGDGSKVVKMDYYPTNRTMTFDLGYAGAPRSTVTEQFGKNIAAHIPVPTRPGYTFAGWTPDVPSAMPTSDTTYTAKWTARADTTYKVIYLQQNIASNTYTVAGTESYRGPTDTEANLISVTPRIYAGFKLDASVPGTVLAAKIASDGTTVLKLYYKRNTYAMTIDYNGSDTATKVVDVPFGATTGLYLGAPDWQGHAFAGWSPAPPSTMPAQNVKFTAQWTLNGYTVSFNSDGGSEEAANQSVGYGYQANKPVEPTKNGYVFGGWYSDSALTIAYDFTTPVTADITLYAKWMNSYTVSFSSDGGTAVADQTVNEGAKATAPGAPTKEGFVFGGWYGDSNLTTAYDFTTAVVTADITLYAKWTIDIKNSYTVSFVSNGGTAVADQTVDEGAVAAAPNAPTRVGYTFNGWYSDSNLTSTYGFTVAVTGNITLYAKWTINSYTVSFNSNGGSAVSSQPVNYSGMSAAPDAPTRQGFVFSGWYSDLAGTNAYVFTTPVTANMTLYAKWTASYTVSFDSNGGSTVNSLPVNYNGTATTPAAPTKEGYTFGGWYSDNGLNEAYNFMTPVTANVTLYAKWMSSSYTVSFNSNGGSAVDSQTVNPDGTAAAPAAPTWDGYSFEGWYTDLAGTNAYDFASPVTADITLYAQWTMSAWRSVGDAMNKASEMFGNSWLNLVFGSDGTPYAAYSFASNLFVMKYEGGEWKTIGDVTDFGYGTTMTLAIDGHDNLYVDYLSSDSDYFRVVKKYNGATWEAVGTTGSANGLNSSIAFDSNDTPYISYSANSFSDRAMVVKYNGTNWVSVSGGQAFYESGDYPVMAVDRNNTPYVLYEYFDGGSAYITVVKYMNGAWETVGNSRFPARGDGNASFALDPNGVPYVVYNSGSILSVMKYTGNAWETVGNAGFSAGSMAMSTTIAFDSNGTPHVAYQDAARGNKVTVMKYGGSSWSPVSNAGFSAGEAKWIQLAIDSKDNIYVIYTDSVNEGKVTVKKYNPASQ
ncbi:InlB B-repeat-containing protein [Paenibacillus qinlingensis]|uniref:InlB B-repeat-containing protein n=1 Tax=Paenibacillus qinlingensis TaxID=1837343 RepID=UPI0030B8846F